jgi:hypothetical protein
MREPRPCPRRRPSTTVPEISVGGPHARVAAVRLVVHQPHREETVMSRIRALVRPVPLAAIVALAAALTAATVASTPATPPFRRSTRTYTPRSRPAWANAGRTADGQFDLRGFYSCLGGRGYPAVAYAPAGPGSLTTPIPTPSPFETTSSRPYLCLMEATTSTACTPASIPTRSTAAWRTTASCSRPSRLDRRGRGTRPAVAVVAPVHSAARGPIALAG